MAYIVTGDGGPTGVLSDPTLSLNDAEGITTCSTIWTYTPPSPASPQYDDVCSKTRPTIGVASGWTDTGVVCGPCLDTPPPIPIPVSPPPTGTIPWFYNRRTLSAPVTPSPDPTADPIALNKIQ